MAELPKGYKIVPPEDRKKAKVFLDHAKTLAGTGNFEYAIEMFLQGLALDPDLIDAHQALREASLKRKITGGKAIGWSDQMRLKRPSKDDKDNMLNAERLLAYDPGNTDFMQTMLQSALRAGYYDTVVWIGPIFQKANADDKKPELAKFIALRDVYKELKLWKFATDATHYALRLRPDDQDLATEVKNLGAMDTMEKGSYGKAGSFRDSVLDQQKQEMLLLGDKDYADSDQMGRVIRELQKQSAAEPEDVTKAMKVVDAMEKTEDMVYEGQAIDILEFWFEKTKQFRYRQRMGQINMRQLNRQERVLREDLKKTPSDPKLQKDLNEFLKDKVEYELKEFSETSDAYPTEMRYRFEMARRMFDLKRYDGAIPVLQQARLDPKFRVDAGILLGRCFLEAGYTDEADDTFGGLIKEYQLQGDTKSKEMFYWRGRTLEMKNQIPEAIQHYSKVAQWDFGYRDVQVRIKKLRS